MSQTVEHVVLLNVKPDVDLAKVDTVMNEINGLASLGLTLHFSGGKVIRSTSNFSHIFHCRFSSTHELQLYNHHPEHLRVVGIAQPILDFVIADFISSGSGVSDPLKPGYVMRVTLLNLKDGLDENEKGKLIEEIKSRFTATEQISVGETLSHELSKGNSIAVIVFYPDLEAIDLDENLHELLQVKDYIESQVVVDYVAPLP